MENNPVVLGRWAGKLTSSSLFFNAAKPNRSLAQIGAAPLTLPEPCFVFTIREWEPLNEHETDGNKLPRRRESKQKLIKVTLDGKILA